MVFKAQLTQIEISASHKSIIHELETERLFIRSYLEEDLDNCIQLYSDETITRFFDHGKPRTEKEIKELIKQKTFPDEVKAPFGIFSIFCKHNNSFIGQIDLLPTGSKDEAEIGFIIHEKFQNQGYCTEASYSLIAYIKKLNLLSLNCCYLPISKLIATVHPDNKGSKKVLEKLGMIPFKEEHRFGNPRLWYSLFINQICWE